MTPATTILEKLATPDPLWSNPDAQKQLDAVLVFGQGPVVDKIRKEKADVSSAIAGSEDVNFWSKRLAHAAFVLYKAKKTKHILITGGKTGGEKYQSEASLIANILLTTYDVPAPVIQMEDRSINTLENIVNVLNEYIDPGRFEEIGILTSVYHLLRVQLLMHLFSVHYQRAFTAEQVILNYECFDRMIYINRYFDIEKRVTEVVGEKEKIYYHNKKGTEKKDLAERLLEENVWTRALLEVPSYWLPYVGKIQSETRLRNIIHRIAKEDLASCSIVAASNNDSLRQQLLRLKRVKPDSKKWMKERWPEKTIAKLEQIGPQLGLNIAN